MRGRGAVNTPPVLPAGPSSTRTRVVRTPRSSSGCMGAQNALIQRSVPTPGSPPDCPRRQDLPGTQTITPGQGRAAPTLSPLFERDAAIIATTSNTAKRVAERTDPARIGCGDGWALPPARSAEHLPENRTGLATFSAVRRRQGRRRSVGRSARLNRTADRDPDASEAMTRYGENVSPPSGRTSPPRPAPGAT